ncbi:MAG: type II secretion system protein [Deltaproteobacteria bacterium]|nr:type II secretion system protein [Deltaproteobacteria bacterium]
MRRYFTGFTLLEIMIAMAILSISLLALYSSMGNSLRASGMAEEMSQAMQLARLKMSEISLDVESEMARGAFPEDKEERGDFEKPFEKFKWSYAIRKVEIPSLTPPADAIGGGAPSGSGTSGATPSGTQTTAGIEGAASNMANIVSKKISESIRELKVNVSWGEGDEKDRESIVLTTHLVRLK